MAGVKKAERRPSGVQVVSGGYGVWSDRYAAVHEAGRKNKQPDSDHNFQERAVGGHTHCTQERRFKPAQSPTAVGLFAPEFQLRAWNQGYEAARLESAAGAKAPAAYPRGAPSQLSTRKKSTLAKHRLGNTVTLASGRDPLVVKFCVVSSSAIFTRSGTARLFTPPGITVTLTVGADSTDIMAITSRVDVTDELELDADLWMETKTETSCLDSHGDHASVAADAFD
ncbi:hypothetical protein EDB83DRAFT_2317992 [Lactarius deliciosus]|nr:hypothetical protein EDB83DRAFT_2317992 [Lactarius deliciosus]